jgi:3-methyladenine DNA glycosylase/8-oxoguanine DNA glycosylase
MVEPRPGDGDVRAEAWGEGADWALSRLPAMLGADDDPSGFEPRHPVLVEAQRRHPHARIGRTGLVMEALVPAIIEQKVTGQEAFAGFRQLVLKYGERAPGPHGRLWLQPDPEKIRAIPSWGWLELHVDPARSRTLVTAATRARALERTIADTPETASTKLRSLPGIGVWTSAEVRAVAFGDPDAVSFGDYHVAKDIGWALLGRELDDEGLAELLEPWRPHRLRVQMLVGLAGLHRPRRGPRMAPRTHLPGRTPGTR